MSSAIGNGGVFASLRIVELADDDFDFAGRELRVDGVRRTGAARVPSTPIDELGSKPLGLGHQRLVVLVEDDLRDAVAVAHVDEQQAAQIAHAMHPAEQHHVRADVVGRSAPQVCVRVSSPSCSATLLQFLENRGARRRLVVGCLGLRRRGS